MGYHFFGKSDVHVEAGGFPTHCSDILGFRYNWAMTVEICISNIGR